MAGVLQFNSVVLAARKRTLILELKLKTVSFRFPLQYRAEFCKFSLGRTVTDHLGVDWPHQIMATGAVNFNR